MSGTSLFDDVPVVAPPPVPGAAGVNSFTPPSGTGLFDDVPLTSQTSPAPAVGGAGLFDDVPMSPGTQAGPYQDQALSQGPAPTWTERFAANAGAAFRGSLLGSAANYLATRLAPDTVPIDPNTGQPMNALSPREQVQGAVREENAQFANMPSWQDEPTLAGKLAQGSAAVLGGLAGAAPSPESMVAGPEGYGAVRMGWGAAPIIAKAAGVQAGVQGVANTAAQGLNIAAGTQDKFDPAQAAESAGMGAVFGAAPGVAAVGVNRLRGVREPVVSEPTPAAQPVARATAGEAEPTLVAPASATDHPLFADVPKVERPAGQEPGETTPLLSPGKPATAVDTGAAPRPNETPPSATIAHPPPEPPAQGADLTPANTPAPEPKPVETALASEVPGPVKPEEPAPPPTSEAADHPLFADVPHVSSEEPSPLHQWLGQSVVRDEAGEPRVVYHGTAADNFDTFNTQSGELGSHFGTQEQANSVGASYEGHRIIPAYLRMEKPLRLTEPDDGVFSAADLAPQLHEKGIIGDELYDRIRNGWDGAEDEKVGRRYLPELQQAIKDAGYDGVVYLNRREGLNKEGSWYGDLNLPDAEFQAKHPDAKDSYIAFDPEQIKSAVGNRGTFSRNDPNILHDAPLVEPMRPASGEASTPGTVADQAPRPAMGGDRGNPNFSEGTSPYGRVFADAGHDPNVATSMPVRNQVKIIRDQMQKRFGFRDVEINQRSHPKEVRDQLAGFYNGAMEMSHVLGMPPEAIGLNGKLKFTTKPFASNAKVLGSYAPGNREITIPGRSNSFAHEWTHALDHHLADVLANNPKAMRFLSESHPLGTRGEIAGKPVPPGSVGEAFANVLKAIYGKDASTAQEALRLTFEKPTPTNQARLAQIQSHFAEGARGTGRQSAYFARPIEMLARSHEAYVGESIRNLPGGGDATGVAKPFYDSMMHGDQWDQLYPQQAERDAIFHAYTELHDRMRADAILGTGQSPRPGTLGMVDPANWHKLANVSDAPKGLVNKLKREVAELKNPIATMRERAGIDQTAASPGHLTLATRARNSINSMVASVRGYARSIAEQQPTDAAREAFTQIVDRLTPAEHVRTEQAASRRYIGETWEQAVRSTAARNIQKLSDILQGHGLAKMTPAQELALRHVLTEGTRDGFIPPGGTKATPIPDNIVEAAGQTRHLLSTIHDAMTKAGVDVGFAESGYMPRVYDELKITADTSLANQGGRPDASKFVQDATKLHKIMFDQEVGKDPALLLDVHDRMAADQRAVMPQDAQNNIKLLRRNLNEQDKIQAQLDAGTHPNAAQGQADLARLKGEADTLFGDLHDPVQDAVASAAAREWATRITMGNPTDFDSAGPNASLTRARKLPPEADEIMRDWMVNKPTDALPRYMQQSARRIADAQTFGPKREILEGLLKRAAENGSRREDINAMREIVEKITGRNQSGLPSGTTKALNVIHAMGTMALMSKAAFSSLTEPLAFYARTREGRAAAGIMFHQIGDIFKTAHSKDIRAMAEALGIVMSHLHDTVLQDRTNAHYGDAPGLNKLLTNYYKSVGLTQLTNSQLRHTSYAAHQAFTAWSKDLLSSNKRLSHEAAAQFREFGIPDKSHQDFAKWLTSRDGLPTIPELDTPGGRLWSQAVTRLTEQTIQVPHRVDRPLLSGNPVGRLMFGLMSFNYAFFHHVVELPLAEHRLRVGEAYSGARAAGAGKLVSAAATAAPIARAAGHISAAAAAIYLGTLATTAVRERIFNGQKWKEHQDDGTLSDWLMDLAAQRTGVNGPLDPLIQAATGLKYSRDLSSLVAGAQVGFMLQAAGQIISPLSGAGSPDTNTARYNATVGAYNLFAVPAAAAALTVLPGGPFARAAYGAAMMEATSRGAADTVATKFAGPKGMKNDGTPPPKKTPPKKNEPPQGSGSGLLGGVPLGLADDFAAPAARGAGSLISKMPGPLKVPAAIGAGAAGAGWLHSIYTRREKKHP